MELKEFIKKVLIDFDSAVIEAGQDTNHSILFSEGVKINPKK